MSTTPSPTLVELVRGGRVESIHRGSVVVLAADGSVSHALGDVTEPMFPRSALKPVQAAAMVRAGLDLPGDLLALAAASHSGEQCHLEGVRAILAGAGLDDTALRCPADVPLGAAARDAWLRADRQPIPLAHNCSGKHAAMLATCVVRGWDLRGYLAPEHPLQRAVRDEVHDRAGESPAGVTVDGCGAPLFAISLTGLARSMRSVLLADEGTPPRRVADAMRANPDMVAGTGRDVTAWMVGVPGLLAKDGAEGVFAVALPDGRAMAVTIDDGADRGRPVVVAAVLRAWGVSAPVVDAWSTADVLGGGRVVGEVRAAPALVDRLA